MFHIHSFFFKKAKKFKCLYQNRSADLADGLFLESCFHVDSMAIINWKWSEMSLIKVKPLLSIRTLVFIRSKLAFHAYVFFIIKILMIFGQIRHPTYLWSIILSYLKSSNFVAAKHCCSQFVQKDPIFFICIWPRKLFNYLMHTFLTSQFTLKNSGIEIINEIIFFLVFLTYQLTPKKVI